MRLLHQASPLSCLVASLVPLLRLLALDDHIYTSPLQPLEEKRSRATWDAKVPSTRTAMEPPIDDGPINRRSLTSTYREYKKDTEYIAGWLAWTSQRCGYTVSLKQKEEQKTPRLKGKARKAAKAKTTIPKLNSEPLYTIKVSEFVAMARSIASFEPKIEVPSALQTVFDRVILARTKVANWFDKAHSDHGSNKRHSYFITILEEASVLLRPLVPRKETVSEHINVHNRFAGLKVEETDPLDELIPEVKESQLPQVNPVMIEQDEQGLEEDFFFAIKSFLDDIFEVRKYVTKEWLSYTATGEGLTRTALLSNTAVDLVRCAEHQFEQMLVRPKKYPAIDFPVWTLPALLFYNAHDGFNTDADAVHIFIKPSLRTVPVEHACEQEVFCMWRVYAALKMYTHLMKNQLRNSLTAITPAAFGIPRERLPEETWDALFWIQIFRASNHVSQTGFALDEATRGIKHMVEQNEVPIWVTFAVQVHLDLIKIFGDDDTLAAPFREYQETVRKRSSQFEPNDRNVRTFVQGAGTTKVEPIYQNMINILRHHRNIALEDRWGQQILKAKLQDHEVLGKTYRDRDFGEF